MILLFTPNNKSLRKESIAMRSIAHTQRYLPHELSTKYYAVKLYRSTQSVSFVCRRYKISKSSLKRWIKLFDGTKESLIPGSHRPHSIHPNSHTEEEMKWIKDYSRRNPHITLPELYGKLRANKGYTRHPGSLYRVLRRIGYHDPREVKKKPYVPKPCDTPKASGIKWQMNVKVVPRAYYTGAIPDWYYQYTVIDEASRERFILIINLADAIIRLHNLNNFINLLSHKLLPPINSLCL